MREEERGERPAFAHTDERFADIQLLRYRVPGFEELSLRQKELVYHLSEAALWGRDILWDQNGAQNLLARKTLEALYTRYGGDRRSGDFLALEVYLKRVWFSNGIHHHYGCQKLKPGFSRSFLEEGVAALGADALPLKPGQTPRELAREMGALLFDPRIMPMRVNQAEGQDLLLTSSCNYYAPGITQAEAEAFYAARKAEGDPRHPVMHGMNSRLERDARGKLRENVWREGGVYGPAIRHITRELRLALPLAENKRQEEVIRRLAEFYATGDLATFDAYTILWLSETEGRVDFTNGFTEVYGDPLGLKASWEGYVNITDRAATRRAEALSDNAQWFEDHSPCDPRFRRSECKGVTSRVVEAAILGGDLYPSSAIGINLPNSNWVRAEHGSKSVTIGNLTHAYSEAARGSGLRAEFVPDEATRQLLDKYGELCDNLHTGLHECLGHGSGRLLPGVDPDALKAYGSTIEEARADLYGLYFLADPKMVELGLLPDGEAHKAQYYSYLLNGALTQSARVEPGRQIEEAHMRDRALIARWTLARHPEAARLAESGGKHYLRVDDYPALRAAFGELLAEIQRVKSEGDLDAARRLVEDYGVRLDPALHSEVLERYGRLGIAPYKGFINPVYRVVRDKEGRVTDVLADYSETYSEQMLRYGRDYATL